MSPRRPALSVALLLGCTPTSPPPLLGASPTVAPAPPETHVFVELYVGMVPVRSLRNTWTLTLDGDRAALRLERHEGQPGFHHLDETNHDPTRWKLVGTVTHEGKVQRAPLRIAFAAFELACESATIQVHPRGAKLLPGQKNADDSQDPPTWVPGETAKSTAQSCEGAPDRHPFSERLVFARRPLEWAFDNSHMVVQAGGFRWGD